ncbi:MAG: hypothetical protein Kow0042_08310 [Calditrichia bacterium]
MARKIFCLILVLFVGGLFIMDGNAQEKKAKEFQYIGANKCKMCHNSKKSGQQFSIWENSAHAKAFATLATEKAKEVAAKMEIADPQKSEKCLVCHVTGGGKPAAMFAATFSQEEGVGCESCHGPGSEYKSMKVMKGLYDGSLNAEEYGFIKAGEAQCKTCHNEKSPTFKGFEFKTYWEKIAHPVPEK